METKIKTLLALLSESPAFTPEEKQEYTTKIPSLSEVTIDELIQELQSEKILLNENLQEFLRFDEKQVKSYIKEVCFHGNKKLSINKIKENNLKEEAEKEVGLADALLTF
jgi:endonuclease III